MSQSAPARTPAEMTVRSVGLGLSVGLVLTAAITYLALYSGVAISAAIPAAVICTGVIRMAMRQASVLENNFAQTIASSGEAIAVGVVFTVPALVFAGVRDELGYWEITGVSALGGVFGVLFMIPLRRTIMAGNPALPFPESVAAAKVVRAGGERARSLLPMAVAVLGGAVFKIAVSVVQLIVGTVEVAFRFAGKVFYVGSDLSLALVGVGVIVGIEYSASMMVGGAISWLVAIPLVADGTAGMDPVALAWDTWSSDVRFIGLGAMIVAAVWSIVETRDVIGGGLRTSLASLRAPRPARIGALTVAKPADRDLPIRGVLLGLGATAVATFVLMRSATGSVGVGLVSTVVVVSLVMLFSAVSSYTVGLVGNSNNPASALAICAFLVTAILLVLFGFDDETQLVASVLFVSAFVCTAAAVAGDTAQHLKTGALLGSAPRRQQTAQLIGVVTFAFVVAPIVVLLVQGYGLGTDQPDSLKAPQSVLFANLADMVFGRGQLPRTMLVTGAVIAIAVIVVDALLRRAGRRARLYVMPVAIGLYLPMSLTVPMFVGALIPLVLRRFTRGRTAEETEDTQSRSILVWSGLITGEALIGVAVAVPLWLGWDVPIVVLASPALSVVAFGLILALILRSSLPEQLTNRWRRGHQHDGRR